MKAAQLFGGIRMKLQRFLYNPEETGDAGDTLNEHDCEGRAMEVGAKTVLGLWTLEFGLFLLNLDFGVRAVLANGPSLG